MLPARGRVHRAVDEVPDRPAEEHAEEGGRLVLHGRRRPVGQAGGAVAHAARERGGEDPAGRRVQELVPQRVRTAPALRLVAAGDVLRQGGEGPVRGLRRDGRQGPGVHRERGPLRRALRVLAGLLGRHRGGDAVHAADRGGPLAPQHALQRHAHTRRALRAGDAPADPLRPGLRPQRPLPRVPGRAPQGGVPGPRRHRARRPPQLPALRQPAVQGGVRRGRSRDAVALRPGRGLIHFPR
mmetsp:Transcript_108795/g.307743  ORF Transcript_108795/g.307743 Transcript_108795/m.307743 type:complete len:240 (+) Transcript_108795:628-1347(+)